MEWSSDDTLRNDPAAFLLTVVNPHADPPALFASTADGFSILCRSSAGPIFGGLYVSGTFNGLCWSDIGRTGYTNGTRHTGRGDTVLTGAWRFTPAEVEVWGLE